MGHKTPRGEIADDRARVSGDKPRVADGRETFDEVGYPKNEKDHRGQNNPLVARIVPVRTTDIPRVLAGPSAYVPGGLERHQPHPRRPRCGA